MRLVACSLLALVACTSGSDGDDYPVEPGNGGGTSGTTGPSFPPDAGSMDGGGTVAGRVCGLSDVLVWDECDQIGMENLTVTVGTQQAQTSANGAFDLATPSGSNLVWKVTGGAQLASILEYAADASIPSLRLATYQDLAADANIAIGNNVGAVFVRVIHMGEPVVGATGSIPNLQEIVRYDDAAAAGSFNFDATRERGIIWFPNVPVGASVMFTVTPPVAVGGPESVTVVVEADTATFATVVIP